MNKKFKKNSIYLKYNFCNKYTLPFKSLKSVAYFFLKKLVFIQQGFVKLIETMIVKIDIVRKLLNKCCSF